MDTTYQFWMVWCEQGGAPTHAHATAASADEEALRLANANRGRTFYVLKGVRRVVEAPPVPLPPLRVVDLDTTNGQPNPDLDHPF